MLLLWPYVQSVRLYRECPHCQIHEMTKLPLLLTVYPYLLFFCDSCPLPFFHDSWEPLIQLSMTPAPASPIAVVGAPVPAATAPRIRTARALVAPAPRKLQPRHGRAGGRQELPARAPATEPWPRQPRWRHARRCAEPVRTPHRRPWEPPAPRHPTHRSSPAKAAPSCTRELRKKKGPWIFFCVLSPDVWAQFVSDIEGKVALNSALFFLLRLDT